MRQNAKIYVMQAEDGTIKLGHSTSPERRAKQVGVPVTIVHQTDVIELAEKIERLAHRTLALHGKHLRGEWFEASLEDAIQAIEIATQQAEGEQLPLGGNLKRHAEPSIVQIRLNPDLKQKMAKLAKDDRRSLTGYIRVVLERHAKIND